MKAIMVQNQLIKSFKMASAALLCFALAGFTSATPASSQEDVKRSSDEMRAMGSDLESVHQDLLLDYNEGGFVDRRVTRTIERIKKRYVPTGDTRTCINVRGIRDSASLSDHVIYFEGRGGVAYVNSFRNKCPRLALEDRFTYRLIGSGNICTGTIITVLDNFGRSWGSCALDKFHVYDRKPTEDQVAED